MQELEVEEYTGIYVYARLSRCGPIEGRVLSGDGGVDSLVEIAPGIGIPGHTEAIGIQQGGFCPES
jgi:hypothetical protein